jgi:hypothetical protein
MAQDKDPVATFIRQLRELNSGKYAEIGEKPRRPTKIIKCPKQALKKRKQFRERGHWLPREKTFARDEETRAKRPNIKDRRRCAKEGCNDVAVRGSDECRRHGGKEIIMARLLSDPEYKPKKTSKLTMTFRKAVRSGAIPREMAESPLVREVIDASIMPLPRAAPGADPKETKAHNLKMAKKRATALRVLDEFCQAYLVLTDAGDPTPWVRAVQSAREAGFGK